MILRTLPALIMIFLLPFLGFSQTYEVGVLGGFANYQVDLVESNLEFSETNLAWGLFFRYKFDDYFSARLNFSNGQISGDDQNASAEFRQLRDISFRSDIFEFSLIGEWEFFGKDSYSSSGLFKSTLRPYVLIGVGAVVFDVAVEGEGLEVEEEIPDAYLTIPIGGGLKYHFQERVTLGGELALRPTFGDYLDGVSILGNPNGNDWYLFGGLTISIDIGGGLGY